MTEASDQEYDFKGLTPETWCCIDCGTNTAPGMYTRAQMEDAARALGDAWHRDEASIPQTIDRHSEVYTVRNAVWSAAGMEPYGGCLCIGCLEKRLGRILRPKDFQRNHPFNEARVPGTAR